MTLPTAISSTIHGPAGRVEMHPLVTTERVDLRAEIAALGLGLRAQGNSDCSAFGFTFLLEHATAKDRKLTGLDFSEQYLTNLTRGGSAETRGVFFADIIAQYLAHGIIDEAWFPQGGTTDLPDGFLQGIGKAARRFKPTLLRSASAGFGGIDDAMLGTIITLLHQQTPVGVGVRYPQAQGMIDAMFDGTKVLDGVTDMSNTGPWFGHSMVIVGYVRGTIHATGAPMNGYFILRNCGGPSWSDGHGDGHGHAYVSFNFARHNFADLVIVKDVLPPP
jgi:hypothetical protein